MLALAVTPASYYRLDRGETLLGLLRLELDRDSYYAAAGVLYLALLAGLARRFAPPLLDDRARLRFGVETIAFSLVVALVFIFLRPINQFICFQF